MAEGNRDNKVSFTLGQLTEGMSRLEAGQSTLLESVKEIYGKIASMDKEHAVDKTKLAGVMALIALLVSGAVSAIARAVPGLFK